jgi:hypothetical protein
MVANDSRIAQAMECELCQPFRCEDILGLLTEYVQRQKSVLESGLTDVYGLHARYDSATDHWIGQLFKYSSLTLEEEVHGEIDSCRVEQQTVCY